MATGLQNLQAYQNAAMAEVELRKPFPFFPKEEHNYGGTVDQLRRSSASVSNNIAEAYRKQSFKDKFRVLNNIALTEAEETHQNLIRVMKMQIVPVEEIKPCVDMYDEVIRTLVGYIRFLKKVHEKTQNS